MGPAHRKGLGEDLGVSTEGQQEAITLVVFSLFYLGEAPHWNDLVAFAFAGPAAQ